ncbi:MAG: RNA polymerase sigma factor [Thermoanaerobaculia bacterium]
MSTEPLRQPEAPISASDEEIVARVVGGEVVLFEILMRRHNQRVYRTIRAILRTDDEVEDLMQSVYLKAYVNLAQFEGEAQFSTWLTRIAVNEALARLRRARVRPVPPLEDEAERVVALPSIDPDPEEVAMAAEVQRLLETEILRLPEHYRIVLVLRQVEGLSTEETASSLGVSEDVVKTRLKRARAMLRDALFERAGVVVDSLFAFRAPRCDRVVAYVMDELQNRR